MRCARCAQEAEKPQSGGSGSKRGGWEGRAGASGGWRDKGCGSKRTGRERHKSREDERGRWNASRPDENDASPLLPVLLLLLPKIPGAPKGERSRGCFSTVVIYPVWVLTSQLSHGRWACGNGAPADCLESVDAVPRHQCSAADSFRRKDTPGLHFPQGRSSPESCHRRTPGRPERTCAAGRTAIGTRSGEEAGDESEWGDW